MATVCYTTATLTSAVVSSDNTAYVATITVTSTSRAYTSFQPYVTSSCITISSRRLVTCSTATSSRGVVIPARVFTTQVLVHTAGVVYHTNYVTLYSTSCSVGQQPAPPTSTPTPTPVTTYVTRGTTTTQISVVYPTQGTGNGGPTETSAPFGAGAGTLGTRKVPVGAIVGGVIGGFVALALLGFLIYFVCFKKTKEQAKDNAQERLEHSRSLMDGASSPSEGSSQPHYPQMQEAQYANAHLMQGPQFQTSSQVPQSINVGGHQYTHVRQDSMAGVGVAAARPLSSGSEQVYYYSQPSPGQYMGHAEVQDSNF